MNILSLSLFIAHAAAIWPAPQSYTYGNSVVWISSDVNVTYNGHDVRRFPEFPLRDPHGEFWSAPTKHLLHTQVHFGPDHLSTPSCTSFDVQDVINYAVKRAVSTIFAEKFVPWKLFPRNGLSQFEPSAGDKKTAINKLAITQTGTDDASSFKPLAGQVDECYNLTVGADGSAYIDAVSHVYSAVLFSFPRFRRLFELGTTEDCRQAKILAPRLKPRRLQELVPKREHFTHDRCYRLEQIQPPPHSHDRFPVVASRYTCSSRTVPERCLSDWIVLQSGRSSRDPDLCCVSRH
jgi:beta-acetyl hexosaminidase like